MCNKTPNFVTHIASAPSTVTGSPNTITLPDPPDGHVVVIDWVNYSVTSTTGATTAVGTNANIAVTIGFDVTGSSGERILYRETLPITQANGLTAIPYNIFKAFPGGLPMYSKAATITASDAVLYRPTDAGAYTGAVVVAFSKVTVTSQSVTAYARTVAFHYEPVANRTDGPGIDSTFAFA
jgi:hypothetical protein